MAKYLQDLYVEGPLPPFHFSKIEAQKFYEENGHLWNAQIRLIKDLYNYHFPARYTTHDNLWRLHISITTDRALDLTKTGFDNWFYVDIDHLKPLDATGRKHYLFERLSRQIIGYCKKMNYSHVEFEQAGKTIADKHIVFDEPHKQPKTSTDRNHKAVLWKKYDEFENATYIKVTNKTNQMVLFKKIEDSDFRNFDRLSWHDNKTICAYVRNGYNAVKETEDYFKISLDGAIEYMPQTKENMCYYGIELLKNDATFEKGLAYVKAAASMDHGKAKNVLLNLQLNPNERNTSVLMQQPGKRKN
jgi:hypothetical protein